MRRVLDDLVQDLDLALRIVGRRLGSEQQNLGTDQIGSDLGTDIDGIEEAVAGRVRDDREGELSVGRMEILGGVGLLGGIFERIAGDGLRDRSRLGISRRGKRERRGADHQETQSFLHVFLPLRFCKTNGRAKHRRTRSLPQQASRCVIQQPAVGRAAAGAVMRTRRPLAVQ